MKRLWRMLKEYPIIIGILGTFCVMGIMNGYQFITNRSVAAADYVTQELGRESTIDMLDHPKLSLNICWRP